MNKAVAGLRYSVIAAVFVFMILTGCHRGVAPAVVAEGNPERKTAEIVGLVWQWVQTLYNDDKKVVPAGPKNYIVQFSADAKLNVKADCNSKGGVYSIDGNRLSIEITHSTMAACPEGSLEDEFVHELTSATLFFLKNDDLYIDLKYDSGTMRFSKQIEE